MKVQEIMTRTVHSADPDDSIAKAAKSMLENDVGMLPVIDGAELIGVVTDRDIAVRAVAEKLGPDTPVRRIMSEYVATCSPEDSLEDTLATMSNEQVRRLPVCDERDQVVGVIGLADAARRDPDTDEVTIALADICDATGLHCQTAAFA